MTSILSLLLLLTISLPLLAFPVSAGYKLSEVYGNVANRPDGDAVFSPAPNACPNNCNGNGECTPGNNCICNYPYLGLDCSIQAKMKVECFVNQTICTYWQLDSTNFYIRLGGVTNIEPTTPDKMGWVGFMIGANGPMANGSAHIVTVNQTYMATVFDVFASHFGRPNVTKQQIVSGSSGVSSEHIVDVSFVRPLMTSADQHYSIAGKPGTVINVSFALSNVTFDFHHDSATMLPNIDIAGIAAGADPDTSVADKITYLYVDPAEQITLIDAMKRAHGMYTPKQAQPFKSGLKRKTHRAHNNVQTIGAAPVTSDQPPHCLNDCSGNGFCSHAGTCVCDMGFLAVDCSIRTVMRPMCFLNGTYCAYWNIQNDYLYMRVHAETNPRGELEKGWAAVSWGSLDGMTDGQITRLTVPAQNVALAVEFYSTTFAHPTPLPVQSIPPQNVTGFFFPTGIDVSFHRLLNGQSPRQYSLPAVPGSLTNSSIALGPMVFEKHAHAHFFQLDWAATAFNQTN